MLKDALEFMASQSRAAGATLVPFHTEQDYILLRQDRHEIIEAKPKRRKHVINTLATLGDLVKRFGEEENASIWCDFDEVTLFIDDSDRRDKMSVPLQSTAAWKWVCSLGESSSFSQRDLWLKLRTTIRSDASVDLAKRIAAINWQMIDAGESEVDRGKASIGKKLSAKVGGLESVPDVMDLPIWTHKCPAFRFQVGMTFFIDPNEESKTIRFFPLDGEVAMARMRAMQEIMHEVKAAIGGENVLPVYCGCPN